MVWRKKNSHKNDFSILFAAKKKTKIKFLLLLVSLSSVFCDFLSELKIKKHGKNGGKRRSWWYDEKKEKNKIELRRSDHVQSKKSSRFIFFHQKIILWFPSLEMRKCNLFFFWILLE